MNPAFFRHLIPSLIVATALVSACARNPVTGKTELQLVTTQEEISIGAQNYVASRQSQGGDYAIDAELTAYVRSVGQKLAKVSDRPDLPYDFVVLNNSVPNAWALPGGKIAVNRGLLLELNNEAELAAVLGHEIVHAAARHGAKAMERGMLLQVGVAGLGIALGDKESGALLVGAGVVGAQLINKKYDRDAELESDRFGMTYMARAGYDPRAAIGLQETFVRLSQGQKTNWLAGMFATHPPSQERVEANKALAEKLSARGTLGAEIYQAKIAGLKKSREAYARLDDGQRALTNNQFEQALAHADSAIKIEPREALFYGLRADVRIQQKKLPDALSDLDAAITRNKDFFLFYLQRGLVKQQLNDNSAHADLEKSVALLPTATAHYALGEDALKRGERSQARQQFTIAAQSQSAVGKRALIQLAKFEVTDHPEKYIAVDAARDARGYVMINLQNRAAVKVRNIKVAVAWFDAMGNIIKQDSLTLADQLDPKESITEATRVGPLSSDEQLRLVHIKIFSMDVDE